MDRKKIIIIGGGFGGVSVAKKLTSPDFDILILDKANYHLFQPLLYQVATAAISPGDIATPIREIFAHQKNVSVLLAEIVKIDKERKKVVAANGQEFAYDYLVIATGSHHSYFGHDDWELLAPGLKTLEDALSIREKILLSYERAERCEDNDEALKFLNFAIVGAGPTGVEMAGAIAEIANKTLVSNFRKIRPEHTKIYLIEGENQILPSYPASLAAKGQKALENMGVKLVLNKYVTNITSEGIWLENTFIPTYNVIWAAGNSAPSLLETLNVPLDKTRRVIVQKDLSLANYPEIFVIGDSSLVYDKKGLPLPAIASVAIQQGRYVAKLLSQKENKALKPFNYFDKGMMATIGKAKAVAVVGKIKISGYLAWLAWCFIHIVYLISFSNKVLVMIQWIYLYFFNQRRIRLITSQISDQDEPINLK